MPAKSKAFALDHQIVSISVDLGVTTPDQLRHIGFGLEKDTADDDTETWTINFSFQERDKKSDPFTDVVTLKIVVKSRNNAAAEATAKEGLSDDQVAHLDGPVTIASKQVAAGKATQDQLARITERTLSKH